MKHPMEMQPTDLQEVMQGFDARPEATAVIGRILMQQDQRLAVLTDWDGVMTRKHTDGIGGTSWEILRRHMVSDEAREQHTALRRTYQPLEIAGTLTPDQSRRWQSLALGLMRGASIGDIRDDARANVVLRDGAADLFKACNRYGYPVSIRSAGCAEAIEAAAERENLKFSQIVSNRFITDGDRIIGFQADSFTHSLNKNRIPRYRQNGQRPYRAFMVIGDSPHDARMVSSHPSYDTLRIRMDGGQNQYEYENGPGSWQTFLEESYRHNYDAVATDDKTFALESLVHYFGEANQRAA